jgi:hypothetical protein
MKNKGIGALAEQVASKGRKGDSTLLHVQPEELAGIAALLGEDLTINPETGLPEAFSWKKLLGAIGLGAAAAFTGGGALGALLPMSIGTGAGTATTLGALAKTVLTPALIAGATAKGVSAFTPDSKKQGQQQLSDAQKWKEMISAPELKRQRFMADAYAPAAQQDQQAQPRSTEISAALPMGVVDLRNMIQRRFPVGIEQVYDVQRVAEGGSLEPEEQKAQQIIRDAMDAIRGEGEDPEGALNTYLAYYGKDALQDLYKRMSGEGEQEDSAEGEEENGPPEGMIKGPGNGMDDMATARMAHGGQKVLLSNDEFIIPADVVSGLGDGSSEAGARKLYAMMDRVRQDRTGTTKQPGKIKDSRVLPA